jgi:formimidoylglutamate deiminase
MGIDTNSDSLDALAARLFDCASRGGSASIGANSGGLSTGSPADFFTVDLDDPSIAGACEDDLLPSIVFSLARTAVRDVVVGGRRIVKDGQHPASGDIITRFTKLQRSLWK